MRDDWGYYVVVLCRGLMVPVKVDINFHDHQFCSRARRYEFQPLKLFEKTLTGQKAQHVKTALMISTSVYFKRYMCFNMYIPSSSTCK